MKKLLLTISVLILFFSCTNNNKPKPQDYLSAATNAIDSCHYAQAKLLLDSVHILFPKQVDQRRLAKYYSDSIVYLEAQRSYRYADSLLSELLDKKQELTTAFRHELDTNYEDIGHYILAELRTVRNTTRCFLQAMVNDDGETVVKSFYVGRKLAQEHLTLTSTETNEQITARGSSYEFNDGSWHSILTFDNRQSNEILNFVSAHIDNKIQITLNDKDYKYFLRDNEKKMLQSTYELSILLSDIKRLKQQRDLTETQITVWKSKHNNE